jgi:signal transduction histidine kinase
VVSKFAWHRHSALERAAQDIGMRPTPAQRDYVAHEQLRMVLLHTRIGTLAATAFAVLLALQFYEVVPVAQVQAWLAIKVAVAAGRIALAQAYAHWGAGSPNWLLWQRAMLAMLALDGLVWGVAGVRLMGESVPVVALGVAALDAVSCVATFGLQVRLAATAAYVVPMLLPMALGLALRSDGVAQFAAAGQFILAMLLLSTARGTSRQWAAGMLLRVQADRLVAEKDAALQLALERGSERDRFLAKVSHELRTPLHGILGLARLLHLEAKDPATMRRLELIQGSGTHLLGLINDLMDVSRIDAGHFALRDEDFDLAAQLDQVADVFALRAADKGLRLEYRLDLPRPHWVRGDAARLRQVLNNLLGNAVKFTARGSIMLEADRRASPDRVRLTVRDTGEGIGAAELARIFQPFQQGDAGHAAEGVGLGLTIAREIAVAMGGDIAVQSAPGRGSSFSFEARLPAVPRPASDAPGVTAEIGAPLPRLVLVAEDDEVNALIIRAMLDGLGVRNERVLDGKHAVSRALRETDRPELVLMDCRMPVMDGMAATAEIRRQERTLGLPRLPVLALTATVTDADRRACLDAGMDEVIAKPFTAAELVRAMQGVGAAPLVPGTAAPTAGA